MSRAVHIPARTTHSRKGEILHSFTYGVDFLLVDPENPKGPGLFGWNRWNLFSIRARDHGGSPKAGSGIGWAKAVLDQHGAGGDGALLLLAQPRILGQLFNPVSFWLSFDRQDRLRAVIAEVTNTFGDRHSYLCRRADGGPINASDRIVSEKIFHVSPFQPVSGAYRFRFDIKSQSIGIWIDYGHENGGVVANLIGPRERLTNRAILAACLRRPFGGNRVLGLIHWQALVLWWKGARYRRRPSPPKQEVT